MALFKEFLEKIPYFKNLAEQRRQKRKELEYDEWIAKGKPIPPPHIVKQKAIKKLALEYGCDVFVESGTYLGDMVYAILEDFSHIYSIELSEDYFSKAQKRFSQYNYVEIILGDSGEIMEEVVQKIDSRALFWLDGHYSAGQTAKGEKETPIFNELQIIYQILGPGNVVLIDDAREFVGKNDYPSLTELEDFIERIAPGAHFSVANDIIIIVP